MARNLITGMQVHFLGELFDEGIGDAIDLMADGGGVNTLMLLTNIDHVNSLKWGTLSHNPRGRSSLSVSGFTYEPHPNYYAKTKIKPTRMRDPNLKDADIFPKIIEAAKAGGMEGYAFILHRFPSYEEYPDCHMVDVLGRSVPGVFCYNNPEVKNLYLGMVEDLLRSYDLDGIFLDLVDHCVQYGFRTLTDEMAGTLGFTSLPEPEMGLACFCRHCVEKADTEGIDVEAVKKGLLRGVSLGLIPNKVERLSRAHEVFRFLTDVPEYLDWLRFRMGALAELHTEIFGMAKQVDPMTKVALDIYSVSDSWKYAVDWNALVEACDWIKPMYYSGTYPGTTFSPERVHEETLAAIGETKHRVSIVPGINACLLGSDDVCKSVEQALSAGADGVVISWDYALIPLETLKAVKNVIEKFRS